MIYAVLPDNCRNCLFKNCCTWVYTRDCYRCKNGISKENYLKRINQRGVLKP